MRHAFFGFAMSVIVAGFVHCGGEIVQNCSAVDPPAAPSAELSEAETAERLHAWKIRSETQRATDLEIFCKEFAVGQKLTVRERLDRAATVSGELAVLAEKLPREEYAKKFPGQPFSSRYSIHPRSSHLARLIGVRPWLRDYPIGQNLWELRWDTCDFQWPTMDDHAELRKLLGDNDADIVVMAAEALATLYEPEDLSELLTASLRWNNAGSAPSIPVLSMHSGFGYGGQSGGAGRLDAFDEVNNNDPLLWPLYWQQVTVSDYYDRAIQQLTNSNVTQKNLDAWLQRHGDDRESLWYWEYRFRRDYHRFVRTMELPDSRLSDHDLAEFRKPLLAELARLEPLTEAKILLLMDVHRDDRGTMESVDSRICGPPWHTRLTKNEILRLLQGELRWPELKVLDEDGTSAKLNSRLVARLMFDSKHTFSAEDVPQLRQLLDSTKLRLSSDGIAAWHVGISQLLPAALPDMLDDPDTRDGYLRKEIDENTSNPVAASLAAELTRVGLPANAAWLLELFFANQHIDLQTAILDTLRAHSGKSEHRTLLWSLVTDDRFRPIWTFDSGPRKGKSLEYHPTARAARWAINAHAGKQLVDRPELDRLSDPATSQDEMESLLRKLRTFQLAE